MSTMSTTLAATLASTLVVGDEYVNTQESRYKKLDEKVHYWDLSDKAYFIYSRDKLDGPTKATFEEIYIRVMKDRKFNPDDIKKINDHYDAKSKNEIILDYQLKHLKEVIVPAIKSGSVTLKEMLTMPKFVDIYTYKFSMGYLYGDFQSMLITTVKDIGPNDNFIGLPILIKSFRFLDDQYLKIDRSRVKIELMNAAIEFYKMYIGGRLHSSPVIPWHSILEAYTSLVTGFLYLDPDRRIVTPGEEVLLRSVIDFALQILASREVDEKLIDNSVIHTLLSNLAYACNTRMDHLERDDYLIFIDGKPKRVDMLKRYCLLLEYVGRLGIEFQKCKQDFYNNIYLRGNTMFKVFLFNKGLLPRPNNKMLSFGKCINNVVHKTFSGDSTGELLGALGSSITSNTEAHRNKLCACYCTCRDCFHTICWYATINC